MVASLFLAVIKSNGSRGGLLGVEGSSVFSITLGGLTNVPASSENSDSLNSSCVSSVVRCNPHDRCF